MIDYLEQARTINGAILCKQIEAATPGNRKKRRGKLAHAISPAGVPHTSQVAMTAATEC